MGQHLGVSICGFSLGFCSKRETSEEKAGKRSKLWQINLWNGSESYIWVRLQGVSRCHVPLTFISEFDVVSFSLAWREFAGLHKLLMAVMQTNPVVFMAALLGPDFLTCYSTLAKMEPELPRKVHNCRFPSVPFREGLQLEWWPSQWRR